jgi:hypothetical protein
VQRNLDLSHHGNSTLARRRERSRGGRHPWAGHYQRGSPNAREVVAADVHLDSHRAKIRRGFVEGLPSSRIGDVDA